MRPSTLILLLSLSLGDSLISLHAKPARPASKVALDEAGSALEKKYTHLLEDLRAMISRSLPEVSQQTRNALDQAGATASKAEAEAEAARAELGKIGAAKGLVDHAKGKWIGGAEKSIAAATEALKKAATPA